MVKVPTLRGFKGTKARAIRPGGYIVYPKLFPLRNTKWTDDVILLAIKPFGRHSRHLGFLDFSKTAENCQKLVQIHNQYVRIKTV